MVLNKNFTNKKNFSHRQNKNTTKCSTCIELDFCSLEIIKNVKPFCIDDQSMFITPIVGSLIAFLFTKICWLSGYVILHL